MERGGEIYLRYLSGDDSAFEILVSEYYDGLVYYINSCVRNMSAAEDVAEDVLFRLAVKRPRYNGKASFKTWLYAIAGNAAKDYLRFESRHAALPLDEAYEIPFDAQIDGHILREEETEAVQRALKQLKPDYRLVLWLVWYEEMTVSDVAATMKKTEASAEHLLRRAKESLKRELMKEGFYL